MITVEQYEKFLTQIVKELEANWLLIGGSLLYLLKTSERTTADIDLCPIDELTNEKRLNLMDIAQKCGLGIESINPAADYFLRKIPNWKNSITIYLTGEKGNIYRPSIELYFKLKMNRRTESDIDDCLNYLNWHKNQKISFSKDEILQILSLSIANESNPIKIKLLENLKNKI